MEDLFFTNKNRSQVSVGYQCEFMENYVAESNVDAGKGIKSLKMGSDGSVIFYISKSGVLTAIIRSDGSDSGWGIAELSAKGFQTQSFDFDYDEVKGTFRLCYSQRKDQQSELLVSDELELNEAHLEKLNTVLKYRYKHLDLPARTINHITMDQRGVLFSSLLAGTDAAYHYFEYKDEPSNFTLPENTKQVKQLSVGRIYGAYGVFILYDMKKGRTMLFQGFPDAPGEEISQYRFETGGDISCFDLLGNTQGDHILYVAGQGIYKFDTPDSGREEVAAKDRNYAKIDVSAHDADVTVWALDQQSKSLYYLTNTFQTVDKEGLPGKTIRRWTYPLKMHEHMDEFSAIKGKNFTNQLFLFTDQDNSDKQRLIQFWQDAVSKNWQEHEVNIADLNKTVKINSYSVDLHFTNTSAPISDQIHIFSKENRILYVNNKKYFLSPGSKVSLDFTDYINIVCPVDSIAAAPVHIDAAFLDEPLVVDLSRGVQEKMKEKIKSGKDLAAARKQDGTPLISGNYDTHALDQLAAAISLTANAAVQLDKKPAGGISLPARSAYGFSEDRGYTIGDILYSIKKGFVKVSSFIINKVKEGVQLVIEIGGKVLKWIANTAKDALSFIERLWESTKVFFSDLVEFLAFLFNWQDIVDTKDALVLTTNDCLDAVIPQIDQFRKFVVENIRQLKKRITMASGLDALDHDQLNGNVDELNASKDMMKVSPPDSRTNWVNSKKEVMFGTSGVAATGVDTGPLKKLSADASDPNLKKITDLLVSFFKGELSIGEFLKRMGKIFLDIAFDMIEGLVDGFFNLLIDSIESIKQLLNTAIRIPILSPIYYEISGKELSLLDLTCLFIAIPTTIGYKIANKVAPFTQISKEAFSHQVVSSFN